MPRPSCHPSHCVLPTTPYFCSSPPRSVVDPIRFKSTNSFLQAEERSPSFSLSTLPSSSQRETWILSSRVGIASYKNLHKHHQHHDPLLFSFFVVPTALRRLTNKCITHPMTDVALLFAPFPMFFIFLPYSTSMCTLYSFFPLYHSVTFFLDRLIVPTNASERQLEREEQRVLCLALYVTLQHAATV